MIDAAPSEHATTTSDLYGPWYRQPADDWLQALPIGNGRLGAMVFGGVVTERLQLNEGTVWAGGPHDYSRADGLQALPEIRRLVFAGRWREAQELVDSRFMGRPAAQMPYQTVGNLVLSLPHATPVTDYRRGLDLEHAIAYTDYTHDGTRYRREAFASAVDQVIVLRLVADQPARVSFRLSCASPHSSTVEMHAPHTLAMLAAGGAAGGVPGAIRLATLVRILAEGGTVRADNENLTVSAADAVTVLIAIATNYVNHHDVTANATARAMNSLDAAEHKTYAHLRRDHIADYRHLYGRVGITLRSADPDTDLRAAARPTDERIAAHKAGNDPQLAALHFQFGRYLLISCSRAGGQPATLQGLWNDSVTPPWGSKYTVNINTEMNYWPAAPTNLIECYTPLFAMVKDLSVTGQVTARNQYGARGWVCHHNTDGWRGTAPVDGSFWGMWPAGGAWLCRSFWDHYEFTQDHRALASAYPIMKAAAEFFIDTLVEDPEQRWLVTCPSISPENAHHANVSICAGPTMDMQIIRDLFLAVERAASTLGIDADFAGHVASHRARLAPMQIGGQGQLQEWLEDWDAGAPEQQHRHVSHLYGLFPSNQITPRGTPALFAAARKSLELRGDMATGWSLAWKINLWARLQDGNRAHKLLTDLLTPERTAPNLFDLHPPFQIDGNFGAVSGITEMLLQSHTDELDLLPALPNVWSAGEVHGLCARGGLTVGITWESGKLTRATILSQRHSESRIRYGDRVISVALRKGRPCTLDGTLHVLQA